MRVLWPRHISRLCLRGRDLRARKRSTSRPSRVDGELGLTIMAARASTARGRQLAPGKCHLLHTRGSAVLGTEMRPVETYTRLHADQVRAESRCEGTLDEQGGCAAYG